jgi:large-conductance mechanosensitive channel
MLMICKTNANQGEIMNQQTSKILFRILIAWVITCAVLSAYFLYQGYTERQRQAELQANLDQLVKVINGVEPAKPRQTSAETVQSGSFVGEVVGFLIAIVLIIAFVVVFIKLSHRKNSRNPAPALHPRAPKTVMQELNTTFYLLAAIAIWYFLRGGSESHTTNSIRATKKNTTSFMQDVENKVAIDAIQEYEIVKRNGSATDICVYASFVAAAYLQAKDETNYQRWKITESNDCRKARVGW